MSSSRRGMGGGVAAGPLTTGIPRSHFTSTPFLRWLTAYPAVISPAEGRGGGEVVFMLAFSA